MNHLQKFRPRSVRALPTAYENGWQLKRYAIMADGRRFDTEIVAAAHTAALQNLPKVGSLTDGDGNHGIGFQIVHFAEVAVVSPVFYWQWGSVLANIGQMRAAWSEPTRFSDGAAGVVGCIWEMEIVCFEINAWKTAMLCTDGTAAQRQLRYLEQRLPSTATQSVLS